MGLVLSSAHFNVDSLIQFLQTQGNVKTISRPKLAVMSGSKGKVRVGQVTTFVSKVGTNFSSTVNQVTTETQSLKTGLEMSLFGDVSDNTVYTHINTAISEITRMDSVQALGTNFNLPQTADRDLDTVVRARPGDMILLGGITIQKDTLNVNNGVAGNGDTKEVTHSELVLSLRTKVISFKGKQSASKATSNAAIAGQIVGLDSNSSSSDKQDPASSINKVATPQLPVDPKVLTKPVFEISSNSFAKTDLESK